MLSQFIAIVALGLSFSTGAAAVSCGVCSPSIVFNGVILSLTVATQDTGNAVQCNYDTPPISGFNPNCVYGNVSGALIISNIGGACPSSIQVVQKTFC
ncbi:hypothetical protein DFH09DRAFT_1147242 [Mycena vulgaris]|nr:hypothetical protein DFH09DRAFT_1147242 [Mycena vulgaris]